MSASSSASRTPITTTEQAIERLSKLILAVGQPTQRGFQNRCEFVQLAYRFGLVHDIESYALWDRYEGLGARTLDTCFEMGDSEAVISELIRHARQHDYTGQVEREVNDPKTFARWCSYADRQAELPL